MKPKVMLLKVTPVTDENIRSSLSLGLSSISDFDALQNAKKIVVKVNLCKPFPADSGATVDLRVTENMIELIHEQNPKAEVYVVESNGSSRDAEEAFRETGYLSLEKRHNKLHLVNLSKTGQIVVNDRRFRYFKKGVRLSSIFLDCNYFISVAKLKTHEFERFTGVLKNQFGCISTKNKEQLHPYISNVIGDINSILKPDLCIIDGLVAMEGKGPGFGDPKEMNLLIVGNDPVATDGVAASIMGIDPYSVPHLRTASKYGVGEIELKNICVAGKKIAEVKSNFSFIPKNTFLLLRLSLKIHRLARIFNTMTTFVAFMGKQLERLGRALYSRSFTEVLVSRILAPSVEALRIPRPIHKIILTLYLAIRRLIS